MGTVRYVPRETDLMFVGVETGTIETCDSSARVVDISATGYVADGDDYVDDIEILNLAESDGVPVAELWAAYKREQNRTRELCPVGELAGDPHEYIAGDGVVIPWDAAGDPRTGVEVCRECAKDSGEGPVLCDQCGEPCHADDAVTDGVVTLCGSFRGNGCADMIDAHE